MAFEQLRTTSRMLGDRGSARSSHRTGSAMTDRYGKVITVTVRRAASTVLQPSEALTGLLSSRVAGNLAGSIDDGPVASATGSMALRGPARAATAGMSQLVLTRCQGCRCSAVCAGSIDSLVGAAAIDDSSTGHRPAKEPGRHRCRHHPQCVSMTAGPVAVRPMLSLSAASSRTSSIGGPTQLVLRRLSSCRWGPRRPACSVCGFQCNSCQPVCGGTARKYCLSGTRMRLVPKSKAR